MKRGFLTKNFIFSQHLCAEGARPQACPPDFMAGKDAAGISPIELIFRKARGWL
jgi:hypothetical protein